MSGEQILNVLKETGRLIQKFQINLKKCPKDRRTKGYIEARIHTLNEYWQVFRNAHQELVKCTPEASRENISYFVNEDYYLIEDLYICVHGELKDMYTALLPIRREESLDTSIVSIKSNQHAVILPKIQLPTFSGRYEDWPTFADLFSTLVHDNASLGKVQKMHYLKSSITDEAEYLLKHITVTEENYDTAWIALKNRYGNKRVIVNSIIKRLCEQRKMNYHTSAQIKQLLDTSTECLDSLKNLKIAVDNWDPLIIFLLSNKLDQDTRVAWEEYSYKENQDELPTWLNLKVFLEAKFRTLELTTSSTSSNTREYRIIKQKSFHVTTATSSTKTCIKCKGQHTLCHCKEFIKLTPESRSEYVKVNSLCFNCLSAGHTSTRCRLRLSCKVCRLKHHSLLHQRKNPMQSDHNIIRTDQAQERHDEQERSGTASIELCAHVNNSASAALLATALLPVKDEQGHITILRALVDSGSQASFISERAAQSLRLKRTPINGTITGVGSTKTNVKYSGIVLEYLQKGIVKNKDIDLLDLNCNSNIKEIANRLCQKEVLITEDVRNKLEQCLETLKKRIEHEGPTGKRFYIYKTLHTHVLPLTNVCFDKTGKRCLSGSYDRTCKVWDVESGKELKTLSGHQNVVYSVGFNFPSCNRVLTGSFDKTARIWDPESGECLATLWGHTGEVVATQFNAKADYVGTGSMDHLAKLYDAGTGAELQTYVGHTAEVIALQFDPNEGQRLMTGSFDGTISLWDTRVKDRVGVLLGHSGEISSVQYNWDSTLVGSASLDGSARLWDARQNTCLATVASHSDEVLDICFDWAGQRMATSSSDCSARIYDVRADFKELAVMKGHREEVSKVCFSPAGGCLLSASADRSARVWNSATGNCVQVLSGHQGEIFSCAFSYAGDAIVTASKDNTCRIWR